MSRPDPKWVIVLCALLSCSRGNVGSGEFSFDRAWLEGFNIYVYGRPPLDYLRPVNGSVLAWSVYHKGLNDDELRYVRVLHRNGVRVSSNFPTMQGSMGVVGKDEAFLVRTACRDFRGNPSKALWLQPDPPYLPCHNNPEWQDFLKKRALDHVRGEADALHIDEVEGIGGHLYPLCAESQCAGFCQWCIKGFREYLASRFTDEALLTGFGISDITTFDYQNYLQANGAANLAEDPKPVLRKEFIKFQILGRKAQLQEMIRYARNFARRDLLFSANTVGLFANYQPFVSDLDFMVFENTLTAPPRGKYSGVYALGRSLGNSTKPLVMFPNIIVLKSMLNTQVAYQEDWWVFRHWIAEAAASFSSFLIPYRAYVLGGGQESVTGGFTIAGARIHPYTGFLKDNYAYYSGCEPLAGVGVLYDYQGVIADYYDTGYQSSFTSGPPHNSYLGTTIALQEAHIPFEAVFEGDEVLIPRHLSLQDLKRVSLIVVPGTQASVSRLGPLLGTYISEGGSVVYLDGLPLTYFTTGEVAIRETIIGRIKGTGKDFLVTSGAPENIGISVCRKTGQSRLIIHLVNYNYDKTMKELIPEGPIPVSVSQTALRTMGMSFAWPPKLKGMLLSPDSPPVDVEVSSSPAGLSFTVPSVLGYTLAVIDGDI